MDESRLRYSLAVAKKMVEIGKKYNFNDNELKDLFVLEFYHDIGYECGNNSNHAHISGEILKRNNYKDWKEIYYHGNIKETIEYLNIRWRYKAVRVLATQYLVFAGTNMPGR